MSEVNVRKWHNFIIFSHFSSKIGHVKTCWKQLWYWDIFTQPVAVDIYRFVYRFTFIGQSVIMLVPSVAKMKRQPGTMKNDNNSRQSMCQ